MQDVTVIGPDICTARCCAFRQKRAARRSSILLVAPKIAQSTLRTCLATASVSCRLPFDTLLAAVARTLQEPWRLSGIPSRRCDRRCRPLPPRRAPLWPPHPAPSFRRPTADPSDRPPGPFPQATHQAAQAQIPMLFPHPGQPQRLERAQRVQRTSTPILDSRLWRRRRRSLW